MLATNSEHTQAKGLAGLALRMFAYPQGRLGRLGGKMMRRRGAPAYQWTIDGLELNRDDALLDVGCGPGGLLALAQELVAEAVGVDASAEMVQLASNDGLEVHLSAAESLPFEPGRFSVVSAMHTVDLWNSIPDGLSEIHRVLGPDGRVTVVVRRLDLSTKPWDPARHGVSADRIEDLEHALVTAGFHSVVRRSGSVGGETLVAISAQKSSH